MHEVVLSVLVAGAALSVGGVEAQGPHWFYWYGNRLPLAESKTTLVVELSPRSTLTTAAVAAAAGGRVLAELRPQHRRLVVVDLSALAAGERVAARDRVAKLEGFKGLLMPLASHGPTPEVVVDRFALVRFDRSFTRSAVEELGAKLHFTIERSYAYAPQAYRLEMASVGAAIAVANELVSSQRALDAEPDRLLKPRLYAPVTDDWYPLQWHLSSTNHADIAADVAWTTTMGAATTIVAIADTGVQMTHPELDVAGKFVAPLDVYDDDLDPSPGDQSTLDGHGTSCAGLIAARANGGGGLTGGMVGVCPECTLMPIRLGPGDGMWGLGTLVTVFDHTWQNGAQVMSNSWGFGNLYIGQAVYDAMHAAVAHGVTIFFASGNDSGPMAPRDLASDPNVIAVGGSSYHSQHVSYADTGPDLDIVAPTLEESSGTCPDGPGIHTTDMLGDAGFNPQEDSVYSGLCVDLCPVTHDYTCFFSGTSAACPIAAGAAALLVTSTPTLTPGQVRWVLTSSADKIGSTIYRHGFNREMGYGRVNIGAALALVASGTICEPVPETGPLCADGLDNDCDGTIDAADLDCGAIYPAPLDMTDWGAACTPDMSGKDGAACGNDLDCEPLGGNAAVCGMSCLDMCPNGFACVDFQASGDAAYCLATCSHDADCPTGYVCAEGGPTTDQVCTQPCTHASDCLAGVDCTRAGSLCGLNRRVNETADGGPSADGAGGDPAPGDPTPPPPNGGTKKNGCGCNTADGQGATLAALALVALVVGRRRP